MAAQYITQDEAAKRLGIPLDEFKRRLKTEWTHLVPMRDGPTLRFRENQIEELGRQLGAASDPDLPLAAIESGEHGSDDFKVQPTGKGKAQADDPLVFDASDDDIFSLSADAPKPGGKSTSDSSSGDSDVRLEVGKMPKSKKASAEPDAVPTEEIQLDAGPSSAVIKGGSSAKLTAPKSSGKLSSGSGVSKSLHTKTPTGDSSEFELSLDADSDDFELQLNTDSSDEVDLGSSPVDDAAGRSGRSGINLKAPGDSGVSLEKGKKKGDSGKNLKKPAAADSDSDVDFELSLEAEPSYSGSKLKGPKSGKLPVTSDSDSEFELTLDDSGEGSSLEAAALEGDESKGDIFETDFEIPPMTDESGSEAVAIDSDTDLEPEIALDDEVVAEEETGSEVVEIEDETEEARPAKKGKKQAAVAADDDVDLAEVEDEDGDSVASALKGVKSRRLDDEEEETEVAGGRPAPRPWGPLPAIILFPALLIVAFAAIMGFELIGTMMGYQQARKPGAPLVRYVAKTFDMDLKDQ